MDYNDTENRRQLADAFELPVQGSRAAMKILVWRQTIAWTKRCKRLIDLVMAATLIILGSPIFLITAALIVLESPGPVFFTQIRVGKDGRHFNFYKFRSMVPNAEKLRNELVKDNESSDGVLFKIKDDPRITRVGRFIRKFSIDELPQLLNVLLGDMSLVGPRPALPSEVAQYTLEQRKRLHAVPGITCLWQVSGRSEIPFSGQVRLDLEYIRSSSLRSDLAILLKTIPAVLAGKGAY